MRDCTHSAVAQLLAIALDDILSILADVIGVPAAYSALVFAVPALPVGTVMWWALAEWRKSDGYVTGVAFGAVSALLTGQVWTAHLVYYGDSRCCRCR